MQSQTISWSCNDCNRPLIIQYFGVGAWYYIITTIYKLKTIKLMTVFRMGIGVIFFLIFNVSFTEVYFLAGKFILFS